MKQKIKDFLEKMTGMQIIIFEALCVMFFVNVVYVVTFFFTSSKEIAFIAATLAAALAAVAITNTLVTVLAAALAAVAITNTLVTVLAAALAVALATFFVALAAVDVTQKYKVKYWKVFSVYLVEATLLYLSFTYLVPYSTIIVLCFSLLGISYFVSMHYLKTYLVKNPPSEKPRSTKRVDYYGNHLMRLASVTTEIPPLPEPLKTKAYRFVYEKLV